MAERVTLDQIRADIEKAFTMWIRAASAYGGLDPDGKALACARAAENRVAAFLCGVDANPFASMRRRLVGMTPDERVAFFDALSANFCIHCGEPVTDDACHFCKNDE